MVELRAPSDDRDELKAKMAEYIDNGVRLGWLIDPFDRRLHVYRAGADVEALEQPTSLDGEEVLPGFVLSLAAIWRE